MPILSTCSSYIRFLAFIMTSVATILMATSQEKTKTSIYIHETHFTYWSAFKFFVIAYGIASFFNGLFVLVPPKTPIWRTIVLVDWITTTLMITSCGMAANSYKEMEIGVVEAGWSPQCCIVPGFCTRVLVSLVFGFLGIAINATVFVHAIRLLADPFLEQTD